MPADTPTREFLQGMFSRTDPNQFLEIRTIGTTGSVGQQFLLIGQLQDCEYAFPGIGEHDGSRNVYYSVIPRRERRGVADACGSAPAPWADFDEGAPEALPLPPSIVVETSPGKYQALWLLKNPCNNLAEVEDINRAIAALHNADANACDRARVLRLPGFQNLKYEDRPYSRLRVCRPEKRFTIGELKRAFPTRATPDTQVVRSNSDHHAAPPWLEQVYEALVDYLAARGSGLRNLGNGGVIVRCPMHYDTNASLSLHPVRGWHCFGGCGSGRLTRLAFLLGIRVEV